MRYLKQISLIPLVALMVGGCAGPSAIQSSTETDDLYYASTDKTVYASKQSSNTNSPEAAAEENESAANSGANQDEVANPEYASGAGNNNRSNNTYSDYDYYSDDYTYATRIRRFNSPYRGLSYYDFAYTDPYWYGSGFNAYNPFYDPFSYRPGFYSGLSLGLSFGNPFYSPFYGGGYGGLYNPYGYGSFYNGYRNGFYNGFYNGYYANNGLYERYPTNYRSRNYGPRTERSVVPVDRNTAGGRRIDNTNGSNRVADNPGGRPARIINGGGVVAPNTGTAGGVRTPDNVGTAQPQGRSVRSPRSVNTGTIGSPATGQPARVGTVDNDVYRPSTRPARRFESTTVTESAPTPPSFPTEVQRPRRQQRSFEQPQRTYEAPRYEAPRREISRPEPAPRNDSWSQPSRSSSSPSFNNGGGSGGSSGGGGRPRRN